MPTHVHQDHLHDDHFDIDVSNTVTQEPRAYGGGLLSNSPTTTTTVAGTKYNVQATFTNGSYHEVEIDNTIYGFEYTGTANKTLLFMASMSASVDTNAVQCEWQLYKNSTGQTVAMERYFDKANKSGSFTLMGRVSVSTNDTLNIYVSSDVAGAVVSHSNINIEIMQVG